MKVAVVGASGFVGRHVVACLQAHAELMVVTAGRRPLAAGPAGLRHRHVVLDIGDGRDDHFDRLGRPDVVLHLAWDGLPNYRSLHHFETELPRQYAFLADLVRCGLPSLLCTGTCFEYGLREGALDESLCPAPGNAYGHAKDALRRQLGLLHETTPFAFTWARLFYLYGEGQSAHSLYPQLMAAGQRGDAEFPMSGGEQLRDYLPVTTAAHHLVRLALSGRDNGIVNVCSGRPVSVRSLVEGWIAEHRWSIRPALGRHPYSPLEPMAFWGRTERLLRLLEDR